MAPRTVILATAAILIFGSGVLAAQQGKGGNPSDSLAAPHSGTAQAAALLPDLYVVSIDFTNYHVITNPDGTKQGIAYAGFTFKNGGKTKTKPFSITWEFWNHAANSWQSFLGQFFTDQVLEAGQSRTIGGQGSDTINWTIGVNTPRFRVKLDTTGAVTEISKTNNEMIKEFKPVVAAEFKPGVAGPAPGLKLK
jgi:hypothetical protein